MAKTVTLNSIDPVSFEYQEYSTQDDNLIVNFTVEPTFDPLKNYVAYYVYDLNDTVVFSNEINFLGYSIINGQVVLNPEVDIEAVGFEEGQYNVVYNFLNNELSSSYFQRLYIDQISSDRTEVRLNTTQISNLDLISGATLLSAQIQSSAGVYFDFFLDFGDNQLVIANNILLDTSNPEDPTVLIKLYEPLPVNFSLKDECWVVTQVANPVAYNINITQTFELLDENIYLRGPNYNLGIKDQINNSTDYVNYSTLSSTSSYDANTSSSLNYQINSILAERGVEINVDYSDYNNFIYFSSAETRLENFYYKLQLIEEYTYSASLSNNSTNPYSITSSNIWQAKINEIITTFDGYDYFLYYDSGSGAWPKTNSTYPYTNASTANPGVGYNFFVTQSAIAIEFDENNNNALVNSIPQYLRDDDANAEYELFIEMLGEMFDNIWIYYQDVTNKWNADNRLNYGVSKDLVAEILRDLGLKIYQNNFSSNDLYLAFLGVTSEGNTFPFPNITGSYDVPSGYEYIDTKVSASNTIVPLEDIEYSFYKRLYHNLPLLLKKKGTTTGLQNLITTYGIPSTILRVAEFGGKDKDELNDWDYYKQRYNYKLDTVNNPSVETEWGLNSNWGSADNVPNTLQFRFKLPSSGSTGAVNLAVSNPSQSLWNLKNGGTNVAIVLEYTGSGFTTGSYSGSIVNPFYQYANLKFTADDLTTSASVYLPFFNGDWWSVMVTRTGSDHFTLYAADSIYNGDDGTSIGFIASSSYIDGAGGMNWIGGINSFFGANGDSVTLGGNTYTTFSGSYQEIRYYTVGLSSSVFEDYTMNPDSIEGNSLNSAPDQLAFRASLGGELFTGSVSIHPKVTGSFPTTSSFTSDSNFTTGSSVFTSNVETVYLDQPAAGIKNIVSNKIQIGDTTIALGNTSNTSSLGTNVLSQYRSIQQQPPGGNIYTENLAYTEIAFSPQNEINDDIMAQLGFFNMGEFIGDPRQRFNQDTSYPDLDALRNAYFEKYTGNYNIFEYVNLIKYFDNSLFKMIKDFTPARASLASGIVIKQTLLERNKYPQPEVTYSLNDYSGSVYTINGWDPETEELTQTSRNIVISTGGAGGSVNSLNTPWYHFSASIAFGAVDGSYGSLYIGGNFDSVSKGFFNFNGAGSQGTFTNETGQDIKVRFRTTLDNTDLSTQFSCSYSSSTQVIDFLPIDLPADGITYETFSPYIIIPNRETFRFIVKDNGSAGITINNVSTTIIGQSLVNPYAGQVWEKTIINPYGSEIVVHSSQDEFYNGEFSGSYINTDNGGELNLANPFKQIPTTPTNYTLDLWGAEFGTSENTFLNTVVPSPGTASFWSQDATFVPAFGVAPYIQWAKIHSTDLQGNNNSLSLEALETLVTNYSLTRGPFIIISISPRNSGAYYVLEFAPGNTAYTFPGPPSGNVTITNRQIVFNPYVTSETGPFQNSDYNAIINNAIPNRLSEWYQQIDYATDQNIPVNFQQLISGTAAPASVQDSNYTSYQYSGIRYWGSKNTTDNFNSPLTITSSIVQTYQNDNLGLTTLGYASVNSFDTGIYEFAWGGGTYPEIFGGGAVKLSQILNVDTTSSVGIISPLTDYFSGVVDQDLPANSQPQFTQYSTTANIPNTARVMTSDFGVPTISSYMIVSDNTGPINAATMSGVNKIDFNNFVQRVTTNSSGFYTAGGAISDTVMATEISNSLVNGDKWYVTLYTGSLPNPVTGSLQPFNSGSLNNYSTLTNGNYNNPVLFNGVFEVSRSVPGASVSTLFFYDALPTDTGSFGQGSNGMLIWKAIVDGTFVLFNGTTLSGVGKGNLITPTASPTIKDNLTYITQTYGTNPSN